MAQGAYDYGDPNQQYYDDPNQQAYGDPNQQYYDDPNQQAYGDPNQQAYGDPNQQAYGDPNQQAYGDPNQQAYGDPNQQQAYYVDPNQQAYYGDPNQQGYPNYGMYDPNVFENVYPPPESFGTDRHGEEEGEFDHMDGVLWGYVMTPHGLKPARRITLEGEGGLRITLTNYGARVTSIRMPDRYGVGDEVLVGLDKINDYYRMKDYRLGCVLGRMSRPLIGIQQPDGFRIFDELMWETCITQENHVVFTLYSPTGEQGYPSDLLATADYWLEPGNRMLVKLSATSTAPTPVSLSLRLPFNLAGQRSGNEGLLQHRLMINARKYLEEDKDGTLTGEVKRSRKEGLDFLAPIRMCDAFARGPYGGFDHHLILNGDSVAGMRFVARLSHYYSGRAVEIYSNSRCLHIDTLNNLRLSQNGSNDSLESPPDATKAKGRSVGRVSAKNYKKGSSNASTRGHKGRKTSAKFGSTEDRFSPRNTELDGEGELGEAASMYTRSSKETESWDETYQFGDLRTAEDLSPQIAVVLAPEDYPDTVFDKEWTYTLLPGQSYERVVRYTFYRVKKPLPHQGWSATMGDAYEEEEGYGGEAIVQPISTGLREYPLYPRNDAYPSSQYPRKDQYNPYARNQLPQQAYPTTVTEQGLTDPEAFNQDIDPNYDQGAYDPNTPIDQGAYDPNAYYQEEPGYEQGAYDPNAYEQGAYDPNAYEQGAYDPNAYEQGAYDQGAYGAGDQATYGKTGNRGRGGKGHQSDTTPKPKRTGEGDRVRVADAPIAPEKNKNKKPAVTATLPKATERAAAPA